MSSKSESGAKYIKYQNVKLTETLHFHLFFHIQGNSFVDKNHLNQSEFIF